MGDIVYYVLYILIFPGKEVYIGKTCRKLNYRWDNGNGYTGAKIRAAIEKYGWENVQKEILYENLTYEEACRLETEEILKHGGVNHPLVLNSQSGGDKGFTYSEDTIKRFSEGTKKSIKEHPEILEKLSKSAKQYRIDHPETFEFQKIKIDQYSYDGLTLISTYDSIMDAMNKTGIQMSAISMCINGKAITAGGYRWIVHGKHFGILEYQRIGGAYDKVSINQIDKNTGEIIATYNSIGEASNITGVSISGISQCVNNKQNTARNYKWEKSL